MNWAWAASLDQLWQSPVFPVLVTLGGGAFFALVLLVLLFRADKSIANGALAVIALLALTVAVAASMRSFGSSERLLAVSKPVPAQGAASLASLACLDGLAGESVEAACEKALFASAESSAAAVSYTAAQISRLTAHGDVATANGAMTPELATLRRVIERDRYGLVAQVLLTREQCSLTACDVFRSLSDRKQVAANMAERAYDGYVGRHSANWGALPQTAATASATPALAGLPVSAPTGRPTNADFPTSASIPPVNIMGNEPPAAAPPPPQPSRAAAPPPQTQQIPAAAVAPPSAAPAAAARASVFPAPPQQAAPRPATAAAPTATTTGSPAPAATPAAAKRPAAQKQQRTTAPVQLAPPAEPDDN